MCINVCMWVSMYVCIEGKTKEQALNILHQHLFQSIVSSSGCNRLFLTIIGYPMHTQFLRSCWRGWTTSVLCVVSFEVLQENLKTTISTYTAPITRRTILSIASAIVRGSISRWFINPPSSSTAARTKKKYKLVHRTWLSSFVCRRLCWLHHYHIRFSMMLLPLVQYSNLGGRTFSVAAAEEEIKRNIRITRRRKKV